MNVGVLIAIVVVLVVIVLERVSRIAG